MCACVCEGVGVCEGVCVKVCMCVCVCVESPAVTLTWHVSKSQGT